MSTMSAMPLLFSLLCLGISHISLLYSLLSGILDENFVQRMISGRVDWSKNSCILCNSDGFIYVENHTISGTTYQSTLPATLFPTIHGPSNTSRTCRKHLDIMSKLIGADGGLWTRCGHRVSVASKFYDIISGQLQRGEFLSPCKRENLREDPQHLNSS
jgi:hypothetical protein